MVDNPNSNSNNRPSEGGDRNRGGRSRRRRRGKKTTSGEGGPARSAEGGGKERTGQERGPSQTRQPQSPGQGGGGTGQKKRRSQSGSKNKTGKSSSTKPIVEEKPTKPLPKPREHIIKRYAILLYDNFVAAHANLDKIKEAAASCDQLNVVIRAEGNMDDSELTAIDRVKVFAGTAWTTIHERRIEDGWYNEPR